MKRKMKILSLVLTALAGFFCISPCKECTFVACILGICVVMYSCRDTYVADLYFKESKRPKESPAV